MGENEVPYSLSPHEMLPLSDEGESAAFACSSYPLSQRVAYMADRTAGEGSATSCCRAGAGREQIYFKLSAPRKKFLPVRGARRAPEGEEKSARA